MLDLLTADDVLSHVMMLAATNDLLYILVEGSTDCSVIDPHINTDACDTLPSGGKSVVLGAVTLAHEEGFDRLAAVVDRDWSEILYAQPDHDNVFCTDYYDIDATVFFQEQNVLGIAASFADRSLLRIHISNSRFDSLQEMVTQLAFPIGILRYISVKSRLELNLRDFPISVVLNTEGNGVDFDSLIDLTIKRSPAAKVTRAELIRHYRETEKIANGDRKYCSGHDLLTGLAIILYKKCGSKASIDAIARATRGAFNCSDVKSSPLFTAISAWGSTHGREVLSCL
ncbi:hypothetical protein [Streptomyces sp. x-45]|uniref:hypothetical protein n=1 Tax=Streptomyces sp. x-45 TaxID=2789281 RepID=UPI00397FC50D